jgi:hypothetical protein
MEDLKLETLKREELYEIEGGDGGAAAGLLWGCMLLLLL